MSQQVMDIFPTGIASCPYIAQLTIDIENNNDLSNNRDVETIVLLDISGSMGQNVSRIVTNYLPNALIKAGFVDSDTITLITFSDNARTYKETILQLTTSNLFSMGCTYMKYGVQKVMETITESQHKKIRLISISDGELHDQEATVNHASKLAEMLKNGGYQVASSAIRFFTSSAQPDTRGLSSMLQLDNITLGSKNTAIIDINACSDSP